MSRIFAVGAVIAVALVVVGCAGGDDDTRPLNNVTAGPVDPPVARGAYGLSLAGQTKIKLAPQSFTVSSQKSDMEGPQNLVDPNGGYWHIALPRKETTAFLEIDLGRIPEPLATLRVRPRGDALDQMWSGDLAGIQASNDGQQWTTLARLAVDRSTLKDDWIAFTIGNTRAYRYYRLLLWDQRFKSLARLEMYRFPGSTESSGSDAEGALVEGSGTVDVSGLERLELGVEQVTGSSENSDTEAATTLLATGTDGWWRPKTDRPAGLASWLRFDLRLDATAITVLRIRPRSGHPEELWKGATASFEGSPDGEDWRPIARLSTNGAAGDDGWIAFALQNTQAYRYYRLNVTDPAFGTLGRVEFYSRGDTGAPPGWESAPLVNARIGIPADPARRIAATAAMITVSSFNSDPENGAQLVAAGSAGYWHVKVGRQTQEPSWVQIDLGAAQVVAGLRVLPRLDLPSQLWSRGQALWQGSSDGVTWTPLFRLGLPRSKDPDWYTFTFPAGPPAYRYYRILIVDTNFFSIGRVELTR